MIEIKHRDTDAVLATVGTLVGANLRGADLRGASLTGADLRGADLTGAEVLGADLTDAKLDSVIFPVERPTDLDF